MKTLARLALPMLLSALLAACEHQGGATQASVTVPPPGAIALDDEEIRSVDRAAVPGDLALNPIRLNGLTQRTVRAALGSPNFRRRDKDDIQIWQYYGEGCVLHLFLYPADGQRRVKHHEVKTTGSEPAGACFRGIVESRRSPQKS